MPSPIESIVAAGTKLWLDTVDPDQVRQNRQWGATGATSNPKVISDLIAEGRFDDRIGELLDQGLDDEQIAWRMTDRLVDDAQQVFADVWKDTRGNDGYVSFELDPLIDDPQQQIPHPQRVARYVELAKTWGHGHDNRMIKVPATAAGIEALPDIVAAGYTVNVTLIFTERQYEAARDAVWQGAQRRENLDDFKSVYSIFISRVDVYTAKQVPELSDKAQGLVGLVNAKRLWRDNQMFWESRNLPLEQEIIFASTGVKTKGEPEDKYVAALVGSGIQTNPPQTNQAIQDAGKTYERSVDQMPGDDVLAEIDQKVDMDTLESVLMEEGLEKFASPHRDLLALVAEKRQQIASR